MMINCKWIIELKLEVQIIFHSKSDKLVFFDQDSRYEFDVKYSTSYFQNVWKENYYISIHQSNISFPLGAI